MSGGVSGRAGRRAFRLVVVGVAAVVAVVGLAVGLDDRSSSTPVGAPAAGEVRLEGFDGGTVSLADLRGRPVVVNFFASWCPPCVAEMPGFEAVHRQRGDEVTFLGVALQDSRDAAEALAERTGVTYQLVADGDGELYRHFGGVAMPTTVFLDASGQVVDRHSGTLSQSQLDARVTALVDGS